MSGGTDGIGVNDFFSLLGADGKRIRHQVVDQALVAMHKAVQNRLLEPYQDIEAGH